MESSLEATAMNPIPMHRRNPSSLSRAAKRMFVILRLCRNDGVMTPNISERIFQIFLEQEMLHSYPGEMDRAFRRAVNSTYGPRSSGYLEGIASSKVKLAELEAARRQRIQQEQNYPLRHQPQHGQQQYDPLRQATGLHSSGLPRDPNYDPANARNYVNSSVQDTGSSNGGSDEAGSAVASGNSTSDVAALDSSEPSAKRLKVSPESDEKLCMFCMTAEKSIALVPCGHLISCTACYPQFRVHIDKNSRPNASFPSSAMKCPVCREAFISSLKIFF